jgi:hypothetical protein
MGAPLQMFAKDNECCDPSFHHPALFGSIRAVAVMLCGSMVSGGKVPFQKT